MGSRKVKSAWKHREPLPASAVTRLDFSLPGNDSERVANLPVTLLSVFRRANWLWGMSFTGPNTGWQLSSSVTSMVLTIPAGGSGSMMSSTPPGHIFPSRRLSSMPDPAASATLGACSAKLITRGIRLSFQIAFSKKVSRLTDIICAFVHSWYFLSSNFCIRVTALLDIGNYVIGWFHCQDI